MPLRSTFSNLSVRGERNSQGFVKVRDWANGSANKTASVNIADSVTAQAGDLIVAFCVWDPTGASIPTTVSVTDNVSTTYTSAGVLVSAPATTASGTGSLLQAYYGIVPSGVAAGTTVTTTWSWNPTNVTAKALNAVAFSNVKPNLVNARTTSVVTTTTATLASGIANTGDLVLVVVGNENNAVATTGATDTTRGSWSTLIGAASTGAGAATNQAITLQYKIVTGQGIQTASWGGLNASNSALMTLVFKAA